MQWDVAHFSHSDVHGLSLCGWISMIIKALVKEETGQESFGDLARDTEGIAVVHCTTLRLNGTCAKNFVALCSQPLHGKHGLVPSNKLSWKYLVIASHGSYKFPRKACSLSMASKRLLKFPTPKPSWLLL